jgi:hypothetical protein
VNGLVKWVIIASTGLSSILGAFGIILSAVVSPIKQQVDRIELELSQTRALSARRGQELIDLRAAQRQLEDEIAKLRAHIEGR